MSGKIEAVDLLLDALKKLMELAAELKRAYPKSKIHMETEL